MSIVEAIRTLMTPHEKKASEDWVYEGKSPDGKVINR
jgi:hypothetical protein